jgi:selenide,water dikinase
VLQFLPPSLPNANVLVGLDAPDDAGVYKLTDEWALVQTVDFFTPVVDDPYWFGAIAAANALSDIYAMGGRPITALNLVGFPVSKLDKRILAEILRGGADKVREAGAVILGGHSIDDPEPKYGLAVTGLVHPERIGTKAGARPGDKLILTKPIGIGVVTTAIKRGICTPADAAAAIRVMATLNNVVDVLEPFHIRGMTDITGFGLLGHASEMARESRAGIRVYASRVPLVPGTVTYAAQGTFPGGSRSNYRFLVANRHVSFDPAIDERMQLILCDAVTSGGLLIAVPGAQAEALAEALLQQGALTAALIGEVVDEHPGRIMVMP